MKILNSLVVTFSLVYLSNSFSYVFAQDFHSGGFFDSDVSQTGFFSNDQAGIPTKNNTGLVTTRPKNDTWTVSPESERQLRSYGAATPEIASNQDNEKKSIQGKDGETDSFEVKKESSD